MYSIMSFYYFLSKDIMISNENLPDGFLSLEVNPTKANM